MKQILKALIIFFVLFTCRDTFSQSTGNYNGTYNGKISLSNDWNKKGCVEEINEVTIKISGNNKINISLHLKIADTEFEKGKKHYSEYTGNYEGLINGDLTYEAKGEMAHKYYVDYFSTANPESRQGSLNSIAEGQIMNDILTGSLKNQRAGDSKFDINPGFLFNIPLIKSDDDCNCEVVVPTDIKPGGDFYVNVTKTGCVSSYVIWYNGSDKPITHWDGKSVKVELQYVCCDTKAFEKTLIVPDYGSNGEITEAKSQLTEPKNGDPLPSPTPGQLIGGSAIALLITTLLQTVFSGGGSGSVPPVPTEMPSPKSNKPIVPTPRVPLPEDKLPKKTLPATPASNSPVNPEKTTENTSAKPVQQKDKALKMKLLEAKQEELIQAARAENISVNSKLTLLKNIFQTVPASLNEMKDTAVSAAEVTLNAGKAGGEFARELYDNPVERKRLATNLDITMTHFKTATTNYFESGKWKSDAAELRNKACDLNNKFVRDLWNDPKSTITDYASTALGGHFYENAFDPDKSLGVRLMNLGVGYVKTVFSMGSLEKGGVPSLLWNHHKTLISQKIAPYLPEFEENIKKDVIVEGLKIKANNLYYTHINPSPEKTTAVHNLNNFFETVVNQGYDNTIR